MVHEQNEKAQLGCGTLILIAIIVLIFSGGNRTEDLKRDVDQLRRDIGRVESKIDALSTLLQAPEAAGTSNSTRVP